MHCHRVRHSHTHSWSSMVCVCLCVCVFFMKENRSARVCVCMAKLDTLTDENGCIQRTMYDIVFSGKKSFYIMQIHPSLHSLLTWFQIVRWTFSILIMQPKITPSSQINIMRRVHWKMEDTKKKKKKENQLKSQLKLLQNAKLFRSHPIWKENNITSNKLMKIIIFLSNSFQPHHRYCPIWHFTCKALD